MPPYFPRKQVPARSSHLGGPEESKANLDQTGCPNTCSSGYCQARTRYPGPLTESCWGPEPGPGRVWLILDRCFLSSQGSRVLSHRRGSLGSCSIRPAGPQHHGKGKQQPTGTAKEVAGPKADVQGEGVGAGSGSRQPIRWDLWFPSSSHPPSLCSLLSPPTTRCRRSALWPSPSSSYNEKVPYQPSC